MTEPPRTEAARLHRPCPVDARFDLSRLDCDHPALDEWLRHQAMKNEGRTARTYVVRTDECVVGYYCIATGSVGRGSMPRKIRHGLPEQAPVVVLGRLAVDKSMQGRGIGAGLLKDALSRIAQIAEAVGTRAVLVHAVDRDAVAFYARYGFLEFPAESRTMFLPIETVMGARVRP